MSSDRIQQVKEKIQHQQVLVKTILSPIDDDTNWHFILRQLKNPGTNRPIKKLNPEQDRSLIYDAKKQEWIFRNVEEKKRGRKKNTRFIKKTSLTLPPANGKMHYYGTDFYQEKSFIGIGFELNKDLIQIKEKYIFKKNIRSNSRPWIFNTNKNNNTLASPKIEVTTLDELRAINHAAQENGEVLEWNEIIASPSLDSIRFLFAPDNELNCRLNLLSKHSLLKNELGLDLPLFIMGPNVEIKEYSLYQQLMDITTTIPALSLSRKIDFLPFITTYNQNKQQKQTTSQPKLDNLDEAVGALILALYEKVSSIPEDSYKHWQYRTQVIEILNAITLPLRSNKLDECLFNTIKDNDTELASLLLAKGASINYRKDIFIENHMHSLSPLAFAIRYERKEIFTEMMTLDRDRCSDETLKQSLMVTFNFSTESSALYYMQKIFAKGIIFNPHNQNKNSIFTALELGCCVMQSLRNKQYMLAKFILNSELDIDIPDFGAELGTIIQGIADDKTIPKQAQQILALHFINKYFNAAVTQEEMLDLIKLLMTCSQAAKEFLYNPQPNSKNWLQLWQGQSVCGFWSTIMKLAKNRILEIVNQSPNQQVNDETREFLSSRRIRFGSHTKSMDILNEKNPDTQRQQIRHEQHTLGEKLSRTYGLRNGY